MDVESLLGIGLGGTSVLGLVAFAIYKFCYKGSSCSLSVGDQQLKIDLKQIEEVIEKVPTPKERDELKKELQNEMKNVLHKVQSRLHNKLKETRDRRGAKSEEV